LHDENAGHRRRLKSRASPKEVHALATPCFQNFKKSAVLHKKWFFYAIRRTLVHKMGRSARGVCSRTIFFVQKIASFSKKSNFAMAPLRDKLFRCALNLLLVFPFVRIDL